MTTTVNLTIRDLRIATLRTIAELCEHHADLTPPITVDTYDHSRVYGRGYFALHVHLPEDDLDGVRAWSTLLGLEVETRGGRWFKASAAEKYADEPVWLGWARVEVTASLSDRGRR